MSSIHCVVVWEWQCNGQWLPHTPGVTRTLERAYAKKLTRVVLADADPALRGYYVNLRTLTQCLDTPDGGSVECRVRRSCYSVQSPAGRGAQWEWARFVSPPLGGELNYEPLPMEVQCLLEESWSAGNETVTFEGWVISVSRMTARCAGGARLLRRAPHPPYPLTRSEPPPALPDRPSVEGRRPRIPQQHTGSSVHSGQSVQSVQSAQSLQSAQCAQPAQIPVRVQGARSASPRDRKPGLARQILHNLNIFSHSGKRSQPPAERRGERSDSCSDSPRHSDTDCSSTRSARRHSVDTVSTYLSHESKESLQRAAVGELVSCGAGGDDAFEPAPEPEFGRADGRADCRADCRVDCRADCRADCRVDCRADCRVDCRADRRADSPRGRVRAAAAPQWGAPCPACLRPLDPLRLDRRPERPRADRVTRLARRRAPLGDRRLTAELRPCAGAAARRAAGGRAGVRAAGGGAGGRRAAAGQHDVGARASLRHHPGHVRLPLGAAGRAAPGAGRAVLRGGLPAPHAAAGHGARPAGAGGAARGVGAAAAVRGDGVADHGPRARGGVERGAAARAVRGGRGPGAAAARGARAAARAPRRLAMPPHAPYDETKRKRKGKR